MRPAWFHTARAFAATCALGAAALPAAAEIYSCTVNGQIRKSDRPIPECPEQSILNPDGSFKRIYRLPLTQAEQEQIEEKAHQEKMQRDQESAKRRSDLALLKKYPDEATHNAARAKELEETNAKLGASELRVRQLNAERKPLLDEAEFYAGKALPLKLKLAIDANDAALAAQKSLIQNLQAETGRIGARFDEDRSYLRKLWAATPASRAASQEVGGRGKGR